MRAPARQRAATAAVVVIALAVLASLACDKEHTCRPGTVFVHVTTGPFVTANRVDVDVYINGVGPEHTELAFAAGTRGGGVEVQFPKGYPEGLMVRIDLTLKANGVTIAAHREDFTPRGECEAIDVVFVPSDGLTGAGGTGGATGGAGGSAGASGSAGTSGAAGSGGTAGSGGGVAGRGGAGGTSGAAGSGGTGGLAGTGGAAGRGGTGGAAGTGGVAGRGGTGGVAGTGGAAGRGGTGGVAGTGGAAGRGGTGGAPCVPTAEFCYNGADDDCDGRIDCEDSDCTPIAQCVPLDAGGARIGVMLAATATCPPNYTDMTALNQNLSGGACAGCSCRPPTATSCSATIASFGTAADCATLSNPGTPETTLSSTQTCSVPSWAGAMFGPVAGVQAGAFTPTLTGSCVPQGTATPGVPTWATAGRFCAATMVGGGCANGLSCAPIATPPKCVMWEGLHTCQAGSTTTYWNTGFTDSRTCGACTCGAAATGQVCSGMRIQVGADFGCSSVTATLSSAQRYCYPNGGPYAPGLIFTGSLTQPTCPGSATQSGALTATGQRTLCCL